ncbi:MAG: hemerythrin domain-containing protein [Bacteroidota bacterium]
MNNSLKILFDEHEIIVNAIDTAKSASSLIGKDDDLYVNIIRQLITFFKTYADQFHHYKEEVILFPEMSKRNELIAEGVIKEMFENHEDFREMIRNIESHLNVKEFKAAQSLLEKYTEALLDHIAVENDEVFPIAETILDNAELEMIFYRFQDCDRDLGNILKQDQVDISEYLRKQLV